MRNLLLISLILTLTNVSCAQQKNDLKPVKDKWLNLFKTVKSTVERPLYYIDVQNNECTFQILINDVPALISNEEGSINGPLFPISDLIPNSGQQKIEIRLFPPMRADYKPDPFFNSGSGLKVKIMKGDERRKTYLALVDSFSISGISGNRNSYELKGTFTAEVPHALEGWKNGVVLTDENRETLMAEVRKIHSVVHKAYEDHDLVALGNLLYRRQSGIAQAYFMDTPAQSASSWEKLEKVKDIIKMYPIEKDSLAFFGEGRIVALVRTDPEFRGKSAIIGETDEQISVFPIYLYQPKAGAPLEIIR